MRFDKERFKDALARLRAAAVRYALAALTLVFTVLAGMMVFGVTIAAIGVMAGETPARAIPGLLALAGGFAVAAGLTAAVGEGFGVKIF